MECYICNGMVTFASNINIVDEIFAFNSFHRKVYVVMYCYTWKGIVSFCVDCRLCILKHSKAHYVLLMSINLICAFFFFSKYVLDAKYSHQPLVIHWWLWMSLDVGRQLLMGKPLRKFVMILGGHAFCQYL